MFINSSADGRSGQTLGLRLTANNLVHMGGPMVFGAIGAALGLAGVMVMGGGAVAAS